MFRTLPFLFIAICIALATSCSEKSAKKPETTADTFQGHHLNRRYQLPNLKGFVTLPEDWKAQVTKRPDWATLKSHKSADDAIQTPADSTLIFVAKPTLEAWQPHLTRLEIYLDAPLAPELGFETRMLQSGLSKNESIRVLHLRTGAVRTRWSMRLIHPP